MDIDDIITVLESYGWSYFTNESMRIVRIEKSSLMGEDMVFDIPDDKTVPEVVHRLAEEFDPNAHVTELVRNPLPGQPTDVRALCDDADATKTMLKAVDKALHVASKPVSGPVTVLALSRILNDYDHNLCGDTWVIDPRDIDRLADTLNGYLR